MVLRYAHERGLPWAEFPANWKELGKRAGHIRNAEMREACTHVLAFWELKSPGTKNMIDISKNLGENLLVIVVPDDDVEEQPPTPLPKDLPWLENEQKPKPSS